MPADVMDDPRAWQDSVKGPTRDLTGSIVCALDRAAHEYCVIARFRHWSRVGNCLGKLVYGGKVSYETQAIGVAPDEFSSRIYCKEAHPVIRSGRALIADRGGSYLLPRLTVR